MMHIALYSEIQYQILQGTRVLRRCPGDCNDLFVEGIEHMCVCVCFFYIVLVLFSRTLTQTAVLISLVFLVRLLLFCKASVLGFSSNLKIN